MTGTLARILSHALAPGSGTIRARQAPPFATFRAPDTELSIEPSAEPAVALTHQLPGRPAIREQRPAAAVAELAPIASEGTPTAIELPAIASTLAPVKTLLVEGREAQWQAENGPQPAIGARADAPPQSRDRATPSSMGEPTASLRPALEPPPLLLPEKAAWRSEFEPVPSLALDEDGLSDVEINIDRIEVRSDPINAAPRRAMPVPASSQPFITLDAYLKGRAS